MKKVFYKISSFFMALIVLLSTFSFTIEEHFCGDTLVDFSIYGSAKSCSMEVKKPANSPECSLGQKNCCTNDQIRIQGQDELQLSFEKLTLEQQVFVASFVYSYINIFEETKENVSSYNQYRPPLVIRPIFKLDETYLI